MRCVIHRVLFACGLRGGPVPRRVQPLGTYGKITTERTSDAYLARTRYRDFNGRYHRLQAAGPTKSAAVDDLKSRIASFAEEAPDGDLTKRSKLTDAAEVWLDEIVLRGKLSQQSIDAYREAVDRFILPALGELRIGELTVGRLDRFCKALAKRSPSRARQARTVLSQIFALLVRHDVLATNPVAGTSPIPQTRSQVRALSVEELAHVRSLIATWRTGPDVHGPKPDGQIPLIFDVILGTSARIGEAVALRVCDVDLESTPATVTISGTLVKSKDQGRIRQNHPKHSKRWRVVSIPAFTADAIRQRLEVVGTDDPGQPIFCTKHGTWLAPGNVRRAWRDIRSDLGNELPRRSRPVRRHAAHVPQDRRDHPRPCRERRHRHGGRTPRTQLDGRHRGALRAADQAGQPRYRRDPRTTRSGVRKTDQWRRMTEATSRG